MDSNTIFRASAALLDGPYAFINAMLQLTPPILDRDMRYIADLISPDTDFLFYLEDKGFIQRIGAEKDTFWTSAAQPQALGNELPLARVRSAIIRQALYAIVGFNYQLEWGDDAKWELAFCQYNYLMDKVYPRYRAMSRDEQHEYLSFVEPSEDKQKFFASPMLTHSKMLFFIWHKDFRADVFASEEYQDYAAAFPKTNEQAAYFDLLPRLMLGADTVLQVLTEAFCGAMIPFTADFQDQQDRLYPDLLTGLDRRFVWIEYVDRAHRKVYYGVLHAKTEYLVHCNIAHAKSTAQERGMEAVCTVYTPHRATAPSVKIVALSNIPLKYPCQVPSTVEQVEWSDNYFNDAHEVYVASYAEALEDSAQFGHTAEHDQLEL